MSTEDTLVLADETPTFALPEPVTAPASNVPVSVTVFSRCRFRSLTTKYPSHEGM